MVQDLPAVENKNIDDGFPRDELPVLLSLLSAINIKEYDR
jgi:hypothetical protein